MEPLANSSCVPCRQRVPTVTAAEIAELHPQVADWQIVMRDEIDQLERVFLFRDFVEALNFANNIGRLAEIEGHHPAMLVEWGRVTVMWWTHKIGGLHRNDFIMAAKTDRMYTPALQHHELGGAI